MVTREHLHSHESTDVKTRFLTQPVLVLLRKFVFGNRVIDHWNGLSDSCVNCSTINNFKSKIKVELEPEL